MEQTQEQHRTYANETYKGKYKEQRQRKHTDETNNGNIHRKPTHEKHRKQTLNTNKEIKQRTHNEKR